MIFVDKVPSVGVQLLVPAENFASIFDMRGKVIEEAPWSCALKEIFKVFPGTLKVKRVKQYQNSDFDIFINHQFECPVNFIAKISRMNDEYYKMIVPNTIEPCNEACQRER